jgi:hypothetical protein
LLGVDRCSQVRHLVLGAARECGHRALDLGLGRAGQVVVVLDRFDGGRDRCGVEPLLACERDLRGECPKRDLVTAAGELFEYRNQGAKESGVCSR